MKSEAEIRLDELERNPHDDHCEYGIVTYCECRARRMYELHALIGQSAKATRYFRGDGVEMPGPDVALASGCFIVPQPPATVDAAKLRELITYLDTNVAQSKQFEEDWNTGKVKCDSEDMLIAQGHRDAYEELSRSLAALLPDEGKRK